MNFVTIGRHRINLDAIADVHEWQDGDVDVQYAFWSESGENQLRLRGNDAQHLLAILDANRLRGPKCQAGGCYAEATHFDGPKYRCDEHAQPAPVNPPAVVEAMMAEDEDDEVYQTIDES